MADIWIVTETGSDARGNPMMLVAAVSALVAAYSAQETGAPMAFVTIDGDCTRASVLGDDVTRLCRGPLVNTTFTNGRSNFLLQLDGLAALSFSGAGNLQVRDGDNVTQPIDRVIIIYDESPHEPAITAAVGQCRFGNPYKGPIVVRCTAETGAGLIEATFRSDGSEPTVAEF